MRRGDTLVTVLSREGVNRRTSHDIATALRQSGADLRRVRPSDEIEITRTLEGDVIAVRCKSSPWLVFGAVATDVGWEVRRVETRPDLRVEAVSGEVRSSLFETVEALGESPQLVLELVQTTGASWRWPASRTQEAEEDREILVQAVADISFEAVTGRLERKAIHAALARAGAPDRANVLAAEVERRVASKGPPGANVIADCVIYALSALFALVVLLALMVIALAWGTRPVPARFFAGWRDVFAALRDTRSPEERWTVYLMVVGQLASKSGWVVVGVVAAGGFPTVGAICLDVPGTINAVGDNAVKVIDAFRGSRRSP